MVNSKILILGSFLIFIIILVSCTNKPTCNKPYILVGNECCLDKDDNGICDKDETKDVSQKIETKSQLNTTTEKSIDKKELAEKTALRFARYWEKKDWENMYDLFIANLKALKSKERFVKIIIRDYDLTSVSMRLDKVELDNESVAFAYYTAETALAGIKTQAIQLEWNGKEWKVNAFATYFNTCDEFDKNCCGNGLCEEKENDVYCWKDCKQSQQDVDFKAKDVDLEFLGTIYKIKILNLSSDKKLLTLSYNDRDFTLNINNNRDFNNVYNLKDNVYINYGCCGVTNHLILTLFNRD